MALVIDKFGNIIVNAGGKAHRTGWVYARDYAESQARPTLFPYYEQYMREIGKA